MTRRSVHTCPVCGHKETLAMADDSCLVVYDCPACGARLRPRSGDCCVFCSYGDTPCPPIQSAREAVVRDGEPRR